MKRSDPIIWKQDQQELLRVTRICNELVNILRKDHVLFGKISRRTKRWIEKQDKLALAALDAKDDAIRRGKLRQAALAKLTKKDLDALGLLNPDADEDPDEIS